MRRSWFMLGLATLAAAWLGPLPSWATQAFWAHMTMHMAVVAVAAPLLILGLRGGRFDPVPHAPRWFAPIPASVVELFVVWGWHAPALHHWARHTTTGLWLEQTTFLLSGMWVWLSALRPQRNVAGIMALLLTSMHMTLLGALLALTPRPLYVHSTDRSAVESLADQHWGGVIMLLVGGVAYLVGGLGLTSGLLRARERAA